MEEKERREGEHKVKKKTISCFFFSFIVLHGERRLGGSFDHLTMDFFHLPPIPEAVPLQFCKPKSPKFEEDETDYDDSSECSDFNSPS